MSGKMEKLLQWSIANTQKNEDGKTHDQPDPKALAELFGLGGPSEPELMKHAMAVISNPDATVDNKLIAFENFEMLIENLDNANLMKNLKLWEPLIKVLDDKDDELRACALSTIGSAVQNNQTTQNDFMSYETGLIKIMDLAKDNKEQPSSVRIKAFFAITCLVRHNVEILNKFISLKGINLTADALNETPENPKLKLRALSLVSAMLATATVNEEFVSELRCQNILAACIRSLTPNETNIYVLDRILNILAHLISNGIKFTEEETDDLQKKIISIEPLKDRLNEDDYQILKQVLKI
ncbi:related to Hsp70 nucleotide exchange factor FES1 [Saccharomycodes ludwigii]|uniref:Hsp70 nucleotide exchange factor FES1 n=1 Tax=Saccharomycodes ludwigii TaxID=36035 RepID=A0A376B5E1_9ASCO|nr:hypothetical protein SCDLUD_000717 [Saccharomycodes ludwigii]KAH3903105.1 hypothetical protein SCDLUD_000717 [Saccharomycodes ludwigii]SSD59906.1 related to Hsp70 nucleotide exchange factor FES1 [Saccharomycodes ludwigii]